MVDAETYLKLHNDVEELKLLRTELDAKRKEMLDAKEAFDMEAKTGEIKAFTSWRVFMTINSYKSLLNMVEARISYIQANEAYQDYVKKIGAE